jgi:DNA replication and repair protein RecF
MLRLNSLSLVQFKNYRHWKADFNAKIIGISGRNGAGKTNLLDAIHYLCFTRSYFTRQDSINIQREHAGFRLEGEFELWQKKEQAVCILRENGKKEFRVDDRPYEKFSHHIGRYPCVIIAPDDIQIIAGGSEERRRFMDSLLCQLDALYLRHLILYNKVLLQRNSLLRSFAEKGARDPELLAVFDEQLTTAGEKIFEKRKDFMVAFLPSCKQAYEQISRQLEGQASVPEIVNLFYDSELLQASLPELLKLNQTKDMLAMRTTSGIHRDDLEFTLNAQPFRTNASQGQRKSLLFAIRLAEMNALKKEKSFAPLLLLDDIFEKLDEERVTNLLRSVCVENEGQVFITDTSANRLAEQLGKLDVNHQIIEL